jgi:hypothetical protein
MVALCACVGLMGLPASADVLDFEDAAGVILKDGPYHGFNLAWWQVIAKSTSVYPYQANNIVGEYAVARRAFDWSPVMFSDGSTFYFDGADFAPNASSDAWIVIRGYLAGELQYETSAQWTTPTLRTEFTGYGTVPIDRIDFSAYEGLYGQAFMMDNFAYRPVPEPISAYTMMLAVGAWMRRRRR